MKGVAQKTDDFDDVDDIPKDIMRSIATFLVEYSEEEHNKIEFKGVASRNKALKAVVSKLHAALRCPFDLVRPHGHRA
jgi:inorganic pyrophosphatase